MFSTCQLYTCFLNTEATFSVNFSWLEAFWGTKYMFTSFVAGNWATYCTSVTLIVMVTEKPNGVTKGAFFWDYSERWILGIDGIRVFLGAIPFSEWTEYHSGTRMNRMNGIRITWNTQNARSFGKFLAGKPTRPPAPVVWLPVGRRSSSQVTSAMSIPFSEWMSVLLEIEIPCILLFLHWNRNNQNSPKRIHSKN